MNPDAVEEHLNANIDYSCIKRNVALAEMLKSMDADIIIFADASPRHAERVVAELGILEHTHMLFTSIPGELNLPLKSTSTEAAFERVGHFLETSPNLISYVGDIVSYLQLADRLGWKPIRVDGFLIPGAPCDCLTIETIQHLPNVLKPITPERE
jgi:FMN phosphatase YigB (HAD superfamily)